MIRTIPSKRWSDQLDPGEDVTYEGLAMSAAPRALIEPESVHQGDFNTSEIGPITQDASLGIFGSITKSGSLAVNLRTVTTLPEKVAITGGTTDMVVCCSQFFLHILFRGYVTIEPDGFGALISYVNFQAFNISSTNQTIPDTTVIKFVCLLGPILPQPTTPNAELVVTPAKLFNVENEPINVDGLNAMANPTATIAPNSITGIEANSRDLLNIATRYAGLRGTLTITPATAVAQGTTVVLGDIAITGAVSGDVVIVSSPGRAGPLFTGYVSAADTVTVWARNNTFGNVTIPDMTVVTAAVLQAP